MEERSLFQYQKKVSNKFNKSYKDFLKLHRQPQKKTSQYVQINLIST